jgi:hypothetical protein
MAKTITKKIQKVELIKVEKSYRHGVNPKFFYNFTFEGIDEPLLVIQEGEPLPPQMVGHKIKYKLDDDNLVSEFELL